MSGDLLFLAHRLPYPPDRGDRIRSWHMLRALAKLRTVHVIAPLDREADRLHFAAVEAVAASVTVAVRGQSKGMAMARALAKGLPGSVEIFSVPALHRATRALLDSGTIDTVFAFSGQMAHYVPQGWRGRFVMDFVDMDSAKFAQQATTARGLMRLALKREARTLRAFEFATARRADASLFVSHAEAEVFTDETGLAAQVVENGVDAEHFAPDTVAAVAASHPLIVFTGQMDYAPNVEAVTGFVERVMPGLPDVTFAIVGRAPTVEVRALAGSNVIVTGEVPDTRPWLAAADLVVAPLSLARGVQNKVLEAMAMGKAVAVSAAAAEGIDAVDGEHLFVLNGSAWLYETRELLGDPARRARIGTAARARVIERYGWEARLAPLAGLIQ